ncbi:MAG TPA: hypothetical protein VHM25_07960 [Polyangiaceae bacterium]|jgi:hypothetical protein|nr:hypothetical protein [Polyangiaceae bacterium]
MTSRAFVLAPLAAALVAACYDMPLIPDDSLAVAGSAGRGSSGSGSGGHPGVAGAVESAGATNTDGGSKPSGAGGSSAGGAGKSPGTAGATSQAGSSGGLEVTWLELSESTAPSSFATNADLGIEGVFYAYGDGCSKLTWDDQGRCASGMLCDPGESPDNWGIAIGFDFRNTGPEGTPADTKLTWNPDDHRARGVAWRVRGTAPKLQVWVLNMAPSWHGQCNVMSCEISGPPDGVSPAALNGQLHFDNMIKDTWGSGIDYTFDPAAVHALQFKIAAVKVGAVAFDFCIDALGIVR